jgi:hypothetical protein
MPDTLAGGDRVKAGEDRHCGPTRAEVQDAIIRGATLGTWERCEACQAAEDERLRTVEFARRSWPPASIGSWVVR